MLSSNEMREAAEGMTLKDGKLRFNPSISMDKRRLVTLQVMKDFNAGRIPFNQVIGIYVKGLDITGKHVFAATHQLSYPLAIIKNILKNYVPYETIGNVPGNQYYCGTDNHEMLHRNYMTGILKVEKEHPIFKGDSRKYGKVLYTDIVANDILTEKEFGQINLRYFYADDAFYPMEKDAILLPHLLVDDNIYLKRSDKKANTISDLGIQYEHHENITIVLIYRKGTGSITVREAQDELSTGKFTKTSTLIPTDASWYLNRFMDASSPIINPLITNPDTSTGDIYFTYKFPYIDEQVFLAILKDYMMEDFSNGHKSNTSLEGKLRILNRDGLFSLHEDQR